MMTRLRISLLAALVALAGCSDPFNQNAPEFDGQKFRTSVKADGDKSQFVVTVKGADKSLAGAREAGRYAATKHCIERFGASDVTWAHGPDAAEDALQRDGDDLMFEGVCDAA